MRLLRLRQQVFSLQETSECLRLFSPQWCLFGVTSLWSQKMLFHMDGMVWFSHQERPPSVKSLSSLPSSSPFTQRRRHYAGALVEISAQWRSSSSNGLRNCAWDELYWNALWLIIFSFRQIARHCVCRRVRQNCARETSYATPTNSLCQWGRFTLGRMRRSQRFGDEDEPG